MWTVIYLAQEQDAVERLRTLLEKQGMIVRIRRLSNAEEEQDCFEVLVPAAEVSEAHDLIFDADF